MTSRTASSLTTARSATTGRWQRRAAMLSDAPHRWLTAETFAYVGLLLLPLWLFRGVLLGRELWIGSFDRLNGFLSVHLQYLLSIERQRLATWDPSLFMGVNLLGFAHTFPNPLTFLAALTPISWTYWVAALVSCALLALSGVVAYLFVRDHTVHALPAFVGAVLYQLSSSSVLRIAQNDMTFMVWLLLPLGMLFLRRLARRPAQRILIGLSGLVAGLLTFTFLQEAAYAILLLGVFSLFRAAVTRSILPPLVLGLALVIGTVVAFPRLVTVTQEFRQLNRVEPRPFDQVYEFQNIRPREIARWFEDGIYGRYPSEATQLGNNINLREGLLVHSSIFATLLVILAAIRFRGRWLGLLRTTDADAPFHLIVLVLGLLIVVRPVAQIAHWLAFGVDFTHSRAAVAALPGVSVLVAIALDGWMHGLTARRPSTLAWTAAGGTLAAAGLLGLIGLLSASVSPARLSTAEPLGFSLQQNLDLLLTGRSSGDLRSPRQVTATVEDLTNVRVTWDDVQGETAYFVEMREGDAPYQDIARLEAQVTHTLIRNIELGRHLTLRVKACDDDGCAPPSPEQEVRIPTESDYVPFNPSKPPQITDLTAFAGGTISIGWTDVNGESGYRIEFQEADGSYREVAQPAPNWTAYRIGGLPSRDSYTFRLRACLGDTCTPYSEPANAPAPPRDAAAPDPIPAPPVPTNMEAVSVGADTVRLAWAASDFAERYRPEMQQGDGPWNIIGEAVSDPPRYTVGGLAPDHRYRFRMQACNPQGCSAPSDAAEATPSASTARALLDSPELTANHQGSDLMLTWTAVSGATGYVVEQRDRPDQPFTELTRTTTTTQVIPAPPPTTSADFRVRACDASGCSFASKAVIWGRQATRPDPPKDLKLAVVDARTLQITWSPVPGASAYQIDVRPRLAAPPTRHQVAAGADTALTLPLPELNQETWADIRACQNAICSAASPPADVAADAHWIPLTPPEGLAVRRDGPRALHLTWTPTPAEHEVLIEVYQTGETEFRTLGMVPGQAGAFTLDALQPDTIYLLRLRRCVDGACSPQSQVTAAATQTTESVATSEPASERVTWVSTRSLLAVEYAAVIFAVLVGSMVMLRPWQFGVGLLAVTLSTLMVLDAAGSADLQLHGPQTTSAPVPFTADDSFVARPTDLQLPSPDDLAALHARLAVPSARSVLVCDGVQAPAICTQHVSRFWQLRLADGSSMGAPARLTALPWPEENVGRRIIVAPSAERLPWGILGLLNVRQAVVVDVPFYLNRQRDDGQPGHAAPIVSNPQTVIPRQFFTAHLQPALDAATAAQTLFPEGSRSPTPDVLATSVAEGLDEAASFSTEGQIQASYGSDEVLIAVEPANERRFLVLNELYHPGWHAYVEGREIPVLPVNVVMRGLVIEPGVAAVTMRFEPAFQPVLALLHLVAGCALLAGCWLGLRRYGPVLAGRRAMPL